MSKFLSIVWICFVSVSWVKGNDNTQYVQQFMACAQEHPLPIEDIQLWKSKQIPQSEEGKCFLACFLKRYNLMDGNGKLSIENMASLDASFYGSDPDKQKKAKEFLEACKYVNDEQFSGSKEECERAAQLFQCAIEKAPDFFV